MKAWRLANLMSPPSASGMCRHRRVMWPYQSRNLAAEKRDKIAAKMSPAQVAEAQKLANEWKPKQ
jgi:hypothetical protein